MQHRPQTCWLCRRTAGGPGEGLSWFQGGTAPGAQKSPLPETAVIESCDPCFGGMGIMEQMVEVFNQAHTWHVFSEEFKMSVNT